MIKTLVGAPNTTEIRKTKAIETVAMRLADGRMAPDVFQSSINGPNVGCDINQLWSLLDERAKKNDASNKNGTVGSRGNTTPTSPNAKQISPSVAQR